MSNEWADIDSQKQIWDDFLKVWPSERVKNMTLDEYTNLNKEDSFCYWLESKTEKLGSIWGGSSYKFGIYKRNNLGKQDDRPGYASDGDYAWVAKYGTDTEQAFTNVKEEIVKVIEAAESNELKPIDSVDLGQAFKWKIAALYNGKIPLLYKSDALNYLVKVLGGNEKTPSEKYVFLANQKEEKENIIEASQRIWAIYQRSKSNVTIEKDQHWYDLATVVQALEKKEEVYKFFAIVYELCEAHGIFHDDLRTYAAALIDIKRIHLTFGPHYMVMLERKGKDLSLGFYAKLKDQDHFKKTYPNAYKITKRERQGKEIASWVEVNPKDLEVEDVIDSIIEASSLELQGKVSPHRKNYEHLHNKWIFEAAYDDGLIEALLNETFENQTNQKSQIRMENLNQILFGPPGTGKTFNTINEAVKLASPEFYHQHQNDRMKLREEYQRLLIRDWDDRSGRIAFCTFHQSYSYEDFLEGIKPFKTEDKQVYYDIEDGIFKRLCQRSKDATKSKQLEKVNLVNMSGDEFKQAYFYKISLGDSTKSEDQEIYDYCIKNNCIAIGFGDQNDFNGMNEAEINDTLKELNYPASNARLLNTFIHYLKKDNYVVVGKGNKYVRALGRVTGDYEFVKDSSIPFNHFREVEWLFTDEEIPIDEMYDRNLQQQTIYKLDSDGIKKDFFIPSAKEELSKRKSKSGQPEPENNYVLIIDEINRGNVSSIFGELITLLEPDKRAGQSEEMSVILPYSKKLFSVPSNIYIIGTMNTADRSIEALDTALRRRFSFKEMPSKPYLIKKEATSAASNGVVDGVDLIQLLEKINERIEKLLDKDHCIGHSYFWKVKDTPTLVDAFYSKVIPLLEEYFFGDFGKIGLVIGKEFIEQVKTANDFEFADFGEHYDTGLIEDLKENPVYRVKPAKDQLGGELYTNEEWIRKFLSIYAPTNNTNEQEEA